jgi:hypothetical protein
VNYKANEGILEATLDGMDCCSILPARPSKSDVSIFDFSKPDFRVEVGDDSGDPDRNDFVIDELKIFDELQYIKSKYAGHTVG